MDSVSIYLADSAASATSIPMGVPNAQLDVIWEMSVASLSTNNDELVIPQFVALKLSQENMEDLKSRFR